jgi:hypothetical protein
MKTKKQEMKDERQEQSEGQSAIRNPQSAIIEVSGLTKAFRTYKKEPGFGGAVRGLLHRKYEQTVAVNDVRFSIKEVIRPIFAR